MKLGDMSEWGDKNISGRGDLTWMMPYVRLILILKTPSTKARKALWKYGVALVLLWSSNTEAVTVYFRNLEPIQRLCRFVLHFLLFMVYLRFGKILNIWKELQ